MFFKISTDEDCFSRQTALYALFFVCVVLCLWFFYVMYLLFLQQNLSKLNEMRK